MMLESSGWATLRAHKTAVRTVAFSSNGLLLVSGDETGIAVLWSLESRRPLISWQAHNNTILTAEFWGPNDELVVTHGRDNKLFIWKFQIHEPKVDSIEYVPSKLEDSRKPTLVYSQDVNALNFCAVGLAPVGSDGLVFATPATMASERIDVYCVDQQFKVCRPFKALDASDSLPLDTEINDSETVKQQQRLLGTVMALRFSENLLVAGYESGHVATFDRSTGLVLSLVQPHKSPTLSLSPIETTSDGSCIYVSSADKTISKVDLLKTSYKTVAHLTHRGVATIWSCDSHIVTAGWDGQVRLFMKKDADLLDELTSFSGGRNGITAARMVRIDAGVKRRLKPLPLAWIAVSGKDGCVGLHGVTSV